MSHIFILGEYRENQCTKQNCIPCHNRFGNCRGLANGVYPFNTERWTPMYVTCYGERNIAQDECEQPQPIFSPEVFDCVTIFDVPKHNGGLRPDCSYRKDDLYADEQGRCGIYFECRNLDFIGYYECVSGRIFDPLTKSCQLPDMAPPPCGQGKNPDCSENKNGLYADLYGRCPYYFQCRNSQFVKYRRCDYGSFDPVRQECVIPSELLLRPCGTIPSPCENRPSGRYSDVNNRCVSYLDCQNGLLISNNTCREGQVFNEQEGVCDDPENAPPPCGLAPTCQERSDGKYAALLKGCGHYYQCHGGRFQGYNRCTYSDGGFFFNRDTGKCDYPQNICPPCGYKWYGW